MKKLVFFALLASFSWSLQAQTTKQDTIAYLYEKVQNLEHEINYLDIQYGFEVFYQSLQIDYYRFQYLSGSREGRELIKKSLDSSKERYGVLKNKASIFSNAFQFTDSETDVIQFYFDSIFGMLNMIEELLNN